MWLRQSTAVTVKLGPFVDDADAKTAETALTISQADIRLSKNGGAYAQTNNIAGATHDAAGWYGVPLDATDTNTLGRLVVSVAETGALAVWREFLVLPANVYDGLVLGSDLLQVDTTQISGTAQTAGDIIGDTNDLQARLPAALTADGLIKSDTLRVGGTLQTAGDIIAAIQLVDDFVDELETRIPANLTAPTAAPSATPTVREALAWLLTQARNRQTATASTQTLYADDAVTAIATSALSDNGTVFSTGEWA